MPVLINTQTGLAEDLHDDVANQALLAQTHELPFNDPQGNPVTAPLSRAQELLAQGYSQPDPNQLQGIMNFSKFSSPSEQMKTALEGAAEAATFGLSTGVERALGVPAENIRGRAEVNPGSHLVGQVGGLAASSLIPGLGEENLLRAAGAGAAKAVGLEGVGAATGLAHQVGSAAVKGAVETAMIQGGDEVSRMFASDPDQSVQSAMIDIGLSGLLGTIPGAAFGAASPLWKAANESKVGQILSAIKNKSNGLEKTAFPISADAMAEKAGVEIPSEIKAAISEDPHARAIFQDLMESRGTAAGKNVQEKLKKFQENVQESVLNNFGKTREEIAALPELSKNSMGADLQKSLTSELNQKYEPIKKLYAHIDEQYKNIELPLDKKTQLSNRLGEEAQKYAQVPDSEQFKAINKMIDGLEHVKDLQGFKTFQSVKLGDLADKHLWDVLKAVKNPLRETEEDVIGSALSKSNPELFNQHMAAKTQYRDLRNLIDDLNEHLRVGKFGGPDTFLYHLKDQAPEATFERLLRPNRVDLLDTLRKNFPDTANLVQQAHLENLLRLSTKVTEQGRIINPTALLNHLFEGKNALSPEMRQFILPAGAEARLSNLQKILRAIPQSANPSHTAGMMDELWSKMPGGVMSMVSMLMGHNPMAGYILGQLGRFVGREIPDAVKLATLKYLGSGQSISSEAFKAAVELAVSTIKGEHLMNSAVKNVFIAGAQVLPTSLIPSTKVTHRLDDKLKNYQVDPSGLFDAGGKTPHYLPDHGRALGTVASAAAEYLNSIRPKTDKLGALDSHRQPSESEMSRYDRAIQISEQPLIVLNHIKKGTLVPEDVTTFRTIYPSLHGRLSQKLMDEVIKHSSKDKIIPYQTRLGLSLFMGQPLDSTLTPQAIQSMQPEAMPMPPQKGSSHPGGGKHSMAAMAKLPGLSQTPAQARESIRASSKA